MKGLPLIVRICTVLAMALAVLMSVLGVYPSWSQHHATHLDYIFNATMLCIYTAYFAASVGHPDSTKGVSKRARMEHLFRYNALLFGLVLVFGVNSPYEVIQFLHFLFTIAAIIMGIITAYVWYGKPTFLWFVGAVISTGGMILGFYSGLISLAWGEVIAAFPLAVFMYLTVGRRAMTYEERVDWFLARYYETGMERSGMLEHFKTVNMDGFEWYGEVVKIPKYRE